MKSYCPFVTIFVRVFAYFNGLTKLAYVLVFKLKMKFTSSPDCQPIHTKYKT